MKKSDKKKIEEFIRVDHAGERGAIKIYEGQLLALNTFVKDDELKKTIEEMKEHEREHANYFEQEIRKRSIKPTKFLPLWDLLGVGLGFGSTLMGKKVIEFSNHSSYSFLPNVFKINDFTNLPSILRKVMGEQKKHEIDEVRSYGSRVRKAIIEMSFDAPGSPLFYDDKSYKGLDEINLNKAVTLLLKQYSQNKVNSN